MNKTKSANSVTFILNFQGNIANTCSCVTSDRYTPENRHKIANPLAQINESSFQGNVRRQLFNAHYVTDKTKTSIIRQFNIIDNKLDH
jgi:hypothetical protein